MLLAVMGWLDLLPKWFDEQEPEVLWYSVAAEFLLDVFVIVVLWAAIKTGVLS